MKTTRRTLLGFMSALIPAGMLPSARAEPEPFTPLRDTPLRAEVLALNGSSNRLAVGDLLAFGSNHTVVSIRDAPLGTAICGIALQTARPGGELRVLIQGIYS